MGLVTKLGIRVSASMGQCMTVDYVRKSLTVSFRNLSLVSLVASLLVPQFALSGELETARPEIQKVLDLLKNEATGGEKSKTVDSVKTGDPSQRVTGIVTTFMANVETIERAIELGANLIVTHEPTFYNHFDDTSYLSEDPVYQYKRRLIDEHDIVVWRYHDYIHSVDPDPIMTGLVEELGWQDYLEPDTVDHHLGAIFTPPVETMGELIDVLKTTLDLPTIRYVGDPDMKCERVGLMVGAAGGRLQILFLSNTDADVLVVGEISEWEVSEYVRDANSMGQAKGLIVMGHSPSEDPGMAWLAKWMKPRYPNIPITHVSAPSPFSYK